MDAPRVRRAAKLGTRHSWKSLFNVYEEDLNLFRDSKATPEKLRTHLAFMTSEARRKTEVTFSRLTPNDKRQFQEAKEKKLDQWISHAVFKVAKRAGIPTSRITPMRWVLTWKTTPDETKAKARLVVKGFTDPDLVKLRAEAPTLSKQGRHLMLQLGCSMNFRFEVGDVKTAFLRGDKTETKRA